jgi:hypothetical protein
MKRVEKYRRFREDRDLLLALFDDVYNILHLGGYYRELQDKKAQKIIKIVKSYVDLKLKD